MKQSFLAGVIREVVNRAASPGKLDGVTADRLVADAVGHLSTVRPLTESEEVLAFQTKMGHVLLDGHGTPLHLHPTLKRPRHLTARKLMERINFLREELDELVEAAGMEWNDSRDPDKINTVAVVSTDKQDLGGIADALVDLVYVAKGTANLMGLPWEELWADVHRANMEKQRGQKMRGGILSTRDAIKPEGWSAPRTDEILMAAGYDGEEGVRWDDPEYCPGGTLAKTEAVRS